MNIDGLKEYLTKGGREELGIPYVSEKIAPHIFTMAAWALEGPPEAGRQVWFGVQNANELRHTLPAHVRCRILPLNPVQAYDYSTKRGPFDALLLPSHGFEYGDPNLNLDRFWRNRGSYEEQGWQAEGWKLWFWKTNTKEIRLFGLDHHHAVLWDIKQIVRPLGIRLDFFWLCDGRPPVNEAIPSAFHPFYSSLDIYKSDPLDHLPEETIRKIKAYDGIVSSHSLVTAFRLRETGLPIFHVNSTRFGNEWIQDPRKHKILTDTLEEMFRQNRLFVAHNNRGDQMYLRQYFPTLQPSQEIYIPSDCYSPHRFRNKSVEPKRFLIWDTRQVLLQPDKSPFMKQMYAALKGSLGDALDSQALLLAEKQGYLEEGYLDKYTAVIHLPYNVSTMSIFQQTAANIPVWVPSARLLQELWEDTREPSELSWTLFAEGTEKDASPLDSARKRDVVERWVKHADFYFQETMGCILTFDSIEDLESRIQKQDYNDLIKESMEKQMKRRYEILASWEGVLQMLKKSSS